MNLKRRVRAYVTLGVLLLASGLGWLAVTSGEAQAQTAPAYGGMPYEVGIISSTTDQDILSAPGSNMRWRVMGMGYNVLVEEADALITIKDKAGTPVDIAEISSNTQGFGVYYDFGEGITCSINSGVTVDFSASTADCYIYVNAYRERAEG